jgi:hypothetical protein
MNQAHTNRLLGIIVRNDAAREELRGQVGDVGIIMSVSDPLVVC